MNVHVNVHVQRYMEECCQRKLDAGLDEILQDLDLDDDLMSPEQPDGNSEERFGPSRLDRARQFLWVMLEYPQSSLAAKVRHMSSLVSRSTCFLHVRAP